MKDPIITGRDIRFTVAAPDRGPDYVPPDPFSGPLTDADYLRLAEQLGTGGEIRVPSAKIILSSRDLHAPADNGRRYAGHIGLIKEPGDTEWQFAAITTNGRSTAPHSQHKVWGKFRTLDQAVRKINSQLATKQNGKYVPYQSSGFVQVDGADFADAFRRFPRQ